MADKFQTIPFGKKKRLDITRFRGREYVHLHDMVKDKNMSLQKSEYDELVKLKTKIEKRIKKIKMPKVGELKSEGTKLVKKNKTSGKKEMIQVKESEESNSDNTSDDSNTDSD